MNNQRIFFYRICGTGMGAAACLLNEQGHYVEGADIAFYPPMGDYLKSTGIKCHLLDEVKEDYLKSFDLIVVGNVVPRNSDDAKKIESLGVPYLSFPAAIGKFVLSNQNVVGVAGTHGKTTTTFLLTQIYEKLGFSPGYFIGGVLDGRPSSRLGDGSYFFIESDEYDSAYFEKISKFRLYDLNHLILTSLEFDHADIFEDLEAIKDQFRAVIPNIKGVQVFTKDYVAANDLYEEFESGHKRWAHFGKYSESGPKIVKMDQGGTTFSMRLADCQEVFQTNLIGEYNILNLAAGIIFAFNEGVTPSLLKEAVKKLSLVKRRQEIRGTYRDAIVIDDFAHHPRAVKMTVDAMKVAYPDKKIIVVLEPNSATARSSIFQDEFSQALSAADEVIFAQPMRKTTIKNVGNIDGDAIVNSIIEQGRSASVVTSLDELITQIDDTIDDNGLLLVLSNGTCLGLWESDFAKKLQG